MLLRPPSPTLFPYTTLFRSLSANFFIITGRQAAQSGCWEFIAQTSRRLQSRWDCWMINARNGSRHFRLLTGYAINMESLPSRSEEHTSELQSLRHLVCRLLHATATTVTYTLSLHDALPISIRKLFHNNWQAGRPVRLLGVHSSNFQETSEQMGLLDDKRQKWVQALSASDRLRDKYGESAV